MSGRRPLTYVCMYVFMHVHVCIHARGWASVCRRMYMYLDMHTRAGRRIGMCMSVGGYACVHVSTCVGVCGYIHVYVCIHVCVRVYVYGYIRIYVYVHI